MSELNQALQAILRDLAQARSASDYYSAHLAEEYFKSNEMMRFFKVPNVELGPVSIDLKFAVQGIALNPNRKGIRNSRIANLISGTRQRIQKRVLNQVRFLAERDPYYQIAIDQFENLPFKTELRDRVNKLIPLRMEETSVFLQGDNAMIVQQLAKEILMIGLMPCQLGQIQFYQEADNDSISEIRFRIVGESGHLLLSGLKSYSDFESAVEAGKQAVQKAKEVNSFEVVSGRDGKVYFYVKDENNNRIARHIKHFQEQNFSNQNMSGMTGLLQKIGLSREKAGEEELSQIQQMVVDSLVSLAKEVEGFSENTGDKIENAIFEAAIASSVIEEINHLREAIEEGNVGGDPELQVILNSEQLGDLPPSSISSISFTTEVRNYTWNQVSDAEDSSKYKLLED